jgi:hypothetical protein
VEGATRARTKEESVTVKLPSNGWQDLPDLGKIRRGVWMDVQGIEGSGKSSFALTSPGTIAYADIDQSVDRAHRSDSKVRILPVRYPIYPGMSKEAVKQMCYPLAQDMDKRLVEAANSWARSIVIDTATEHWEFRRLSEFGELNPKGRRMDRLYGPVNAIHRQMFRNIYRHAGKHLVTISQQYDEYKDVLEPGGEYVSKRTGRKIAKGFKEIPYMADVLVRTFKEDGEFKAEVLICKLPPHGSSMEGLVLEGEDQVNFLYIVTMATDTDPEVWL